MHSLCFQPQPAKEKNEGSSSGSGPDAGSRSKYRRRIDHLLKMAQYKEYYGQMSNERLTNCEIKAISDSLIGNCICHHVLQCTNFPGSVKEQQHGLPLEYKHDGADKIKNLPTLSPSVDLTPIVSELNWLHRLVDPKPVRYDTISVFEPKILFIPSGLSFLSLPKKSASKTHGDLPNCSAESGNFKPKNIPQEVLDLDELPVSPMRKMEQLPTSFTFHSRGTSTPKCDSTKIRCHKKVVKDCELEVFQFINRASFMGYVEEYAKEILYGGGRE